MSDSTFTSNSASNSGGGIKNFGTLIDGGGNNITGNSPDDVSLGEEAFERLLMPARGFHNASIGLLADFDLNPDLSCPSS